MSNDERTKNRDSLYKILEQVEKRAPEVEQIGQEIASSARQVRDFATTLRRVVGKVENDDVLSDEQWQQATEGWRALQAASEPIIKARSFISNYTVTASGRSVNAVSIVHSIQPVTPALQPVVVAAKEELGRIMDSIPLMDDVSKSMLRLGLTLRTGQRSALQLLVECLTLFVAYSIRPWHVGTWR